MATDAKVEACPICELDAHTTPLPDGVKVNCRRCGKFSITDSLRATIAKPEDSRLRAYLSCYTRQANEQGIESQLNSSNWRDFARAHIGTPLTRKKEKLLQFVKARSTFLGAKVEINPEFNGPLLDTVSPEEVKNLLDHLIKLGYLNYSDTPITQFYSLTVKGWESLETPAGGIPGHCFVAMSFHPSLDEAYEKGIYLAVKDCGFDPIRIDLVHHNEKICDKILAEIRACQFMVADFTLQRAGVYFEAGFAMGLGRPVI